MSVALIVMGLLAVALVVVSILLLRRAEADPLAVRIDEYAAREEPVTIEEIELLLIESWRLGLKAVALYRDNCKVAQPLSMAQCMATNSPCAWKMGSGCNRTSSGVNPQLSCSARPLVSRLRLVSMAPLERPVVPDV